VELLAKKLDPVNYFNPLKLIRPRKWKTLPKATRSLGQEMNKIIRDRKSKFRYQLGGEKLMKKLENNAKREAYIEAAKRKYPLPPETDLKSPAEFMSFFKPQIQNAFKTLTAAKMLTLPKLPQPVYKHISQLKPDLNLVVRR
jgi:hypothetical protein